MKIAIVGKGNVGSALQAGLSRIGHEARAVGREENAAREAAEAAELIIIAVPFGAVDAAAKEIEAAASGKTVIDATNALTPQMELALGFTASGAEELQKKLPEAKVVKAFNTAFAAAMALSASSFVARA